MSKRLLIEIVTEELPAGYIMPALEAMEDMMDRELSRARIEHGKAQRFGTPRRLAVLIHDVAERQNSVTEEIVGPPKKVAFDDTGQPTKAALGFAKSQGVAVSKLTTKATAKGDYVCVKKTNRGQVSHKVLRTIIPEMINAIPFPKSMRWGDLSLTFARPIHAIVALLDDKVISFKLEATKSGRRTLGHRFMHPKCLSIANASEYLSALQPAHVVADIAERKAMIEDQIARAADSLGGKILPDDELLETVTNLVEYVCVSAGRFDKSFLAVPSEVLITAMREHQKYFAVIDPGDKLLPCFVAVNNTLAEDMAVVTTGHEWVLRARLEDARFFFEADTKAPFPKMVEKLKGVTFQAKLGSMFDKVCRVQKMAEHLAQLAAPDRETTLSRAAWLCKADLTSQMVGEFPKLQGVMGRIYAARSGEPNPVCRAIEEHYMPIRAGGILPQTLPGALLSIADKLDTICACFGIGLVPTGTTDPYALRRHAAGIIQILLNRKLSISLSTLINSSFELLKGEISEDAEQTARKVLTFFRHRMEYLLVEQGFSKDLIAAVVSTSVDDIRVVIKRAEALARLKTKPDFDSLAIAFKRVVNIIKQAREKKEVAADRAMAKTDPSLFQDICEDTLNKALQKVKGEISEDVQKGIFDKALLAVSRLKEPIDGFFDGVMVLTDDKRIKENRLALLSEIADLFALFADFSKIST